ncbi:MAG: winged helix-turn-helix domain-containing protein [Anaerolineales bacterium]|nr:winged helix-turn-helix domain-containing protein [Anaerolineales bacterium]
MAQNVYWHAPLWEVLLIGGSGLLVLIWLIWRAFRRPKLPDVLNEFTTGLEEQPIFFYDQLRGVVGLTKAAEQVLQNLALPQQKLPFETFLDALTESFIEGRMIRKENWPKDEYTLTVTPLVQTEGKTMGVFAFVTLESPLPPPDEPIEAVKAKDWLKFGTSLQLHRSRPIVRVCRDAAWQEYHLRYPEETLLRHLVDNRANIQTAEDLFAIIWPDEKAEPFGLGLAQKDRLRRLIFHLRQIVEPDPGNPQFVSTVHGVGYIFRED